MVKKIEKAFFLSSGSTIPGVTLGLFLSLLVAISMSASAYTETDVGLSHLPDLEAINVWVFPPNPSFESEISLHAFVWNNSDIRVDGPIVVRIGIEGVDARERVIPVLHPWEAIPVEAVFPPLEIDEYAAFVSVDPEDMIPERNEENNVAFNPFHVGPPLILPDLAVIDLKVFPREITPEDEVVIEGMVWNDSEMIVEGPIEVRMGIDSHPVGEPVILNGLYPREARRVSVIARPQEIGEHIASLRVDPGNLIRERRESNNHRLLQFEVHPLLPQGERIAQ